MGALVVTRGGELWIVARATLEERCIFAVPNAQLGECSISADGEWFDRGLCGSRADAGLIVGRIDGSASTRDCVPAHRDSSAVPSARAGVDRIFGRPRAAHAPRAPRRHGARVPAIHTATTSSSCTRPFSATPAIWCSPSGRTRSAGWIGPPARCAPIADYNAWHIAPDRAGTRILCDTNHPDEGCRSSMRTQGAGAPLCAVRVEQPGLAVAQIALRACRGFRTGAQYP